MRTTRKRNPRVVVREELARMRRTAGQMRDLFDLPHVVDAKGHKRKPTGTELPENRVEYWQALERQARAWAQQALDLGTLARLEAERAMAGQAPYLTRRRPDAPWYALRDVHALRDALQAAGMRYSELQGHVADLDAGHLLTADGGAQFRKGEA